MTKIEDISKSIKSKEDLEALKAQIASIEASFKASSQAVKARNYVNNALLQIKELLEDGKELKPADKELLDAVPGLSKNYLDLAKDAQKSTRGRKKTKS